MSEELSTSVLQLPTEVIRWHIDVYGVVATMNTQTLLWNGKDISNLLCNPLSETYSKMFVSCGVFVAPYSYQSAERTIYIPFVDNKYNMSLSVDISPVCRIEKVYEKQGKLYAFAEIGEEKHLLDVDIIDNVPVIANIQPFNIFGLDADKETIICVFDYARNYTAFSQNMSKLWDIEFDDRNRSPARNSPYLFGNSVIICFDQDILSVDKRTGKEIWKYSFGVLPTSIQMVEDKVYVAADELYILDISTGKVLIRNNPGLKLHTTEEDELDERSYIWMYPAENYIVVSSPLDNCIQLHSFEDLSCTHTIRIPDGYFLDNGKSSPPLIANDKLVVSLFKLNFYDIRALMMIDLSKYQPSDEAFFMPMPEIQHRIVPSLEDEHAYSICIDTDRVYEATGYAEVMVKELATELRQKTEDDCTVKTDWVDKKHNGVINIVLDPAGFDEHEIRTIELEIGDLSSSLNSMEDTFRILKLFPTDVPPLKVQPKFLQKSEWDNEGEQIDIEKYLAERAAH